MKDKILKITLAQVQHVGWDGHEQVKAVLKELKKIKKNSTDIIILPELSPGIVEDLQEEARRLQTTILAGGTRKKENGKFLNRVIVYGPEGDVITEYIKMFLHDGEIESNYEGGTKTCLFQINFVKIGILICSDVGLGVESVLALYHAGADIIVVPASSFINTLEYWKWHLVIKSLDTGIPFCMVNYGGLFKESIHTFGGGHSMVVAPLPNKFDNINLDELLKYKHINPIDHVIIELGAKPAIKTIELNIAKYDNYKQNIKRNRDKGLRILQNSDYE